MALSQIYLEYQILIDIPIIWSPTHRKRFGFRTPWLTSPCSQVAGAGVFSLSSNFVGGWHGIVTSAATPKLGGLTLKTQTFGTTCSVHMFLNNGCVESVDFVFWKITHWNCVDLRSEERLVRKRTMTSTKIIENLGKLWQTHTHHKHIN